LRKLLQFGDKVPMASFGQRSISNENRLSKKYRHVLNDLRKGKLPKYQASK